MRRLPFHRCHLACRLLILPTCWVWLLGCGLLSKVDFALPVDAPASANLFDGGTASDAGGSLDAGRTSDRGAKLDAGTQEDASQSTDAGTNLDAGTQEDASQTTDAGTNLDAGTQEDASQTTDAGSDLDAGPQQNASQTTDAGTREDAGQNLDAGPPPDAEQNQDAGGGCVHETNALCDPALRLWLDASLGTNFRDESCTAPVDSFARVYCWRDRSEEINHISAPLGALVPRQAYFRGRSALEFTPPTQSLGTPVVTTRFGQEISDVLPEGPSPFTMVLVFDAQSRNNTPETIVHFGESATQQSIGINVNTHAVRLYGYANDAIFGLPNSLVDESGNSDSSAMILVASHRANGPISTQNTFLRINGDDVDGTFPANAAPLSLPANRRLAIGIQQAGYEPFEGMLMEILVYNQFFDEDDIEDLEEHLSEKWNIAISD